MILPEFHRKLSRTLSVPNRLEKIFPIQINYFSDTPLVIILIFYYIFGYKNISF